MSKHIKPIVLNKCHGGFTLSDKAINMMLTFERFEGMTREDLVHLFNNFYFRTSDELVSVIKILGEDAWVKDYSHLVISCVDVSEPYYIHEYDGLESVEYYTSDTYLDYDLPRVFEDKYYDC